MKETKCPPTSSYDFSSSSVVSTLACFFEYKPIVRWTQRMARSVHITRLSGTFSPHNIQISDPSLWACVLCYNFFTKVLPGKKRYLDLVEKTISEFGTPVKRITIGGKVWWAIISLRLDTTIYSDTKLLKVLGFFVFSLVLYKEGIVTRNKYKTSVVSQARLSHSEGLARKTISSSSLD